MTHLDELEAERSRLAKEFARATDQAVQLEATLELTTKSRSYRVWQKYIKAKSLLIKSLKNPRRVSRGLRVLFTKGPRELLRKVISLETETIPTPNIKEQYEHFFATHYPSSTVLKQQTETSQNLSTRPVISIILPVYNTPVDFLKNCLDSVLAQSYDNWELCVCDDASPSPAPVK